MMSVLNFSGSMYAQYYFALRALRGTDAKNVPRLYMNVSMGAALKVEVTSPHISCVFLACRLFLYVNLHILIMSFTTGKIYYCANIAN